MQADPGRSGASMFPAAAHANRGIFYASNGQPRSLSDIYSTLRASSGSAVPPQPPLRRTTPRRNGPPALGQGGEVVLGNGATDGDHAWLNSTLANLNSLREPMNPLRPTPENAKLAYLMLASLGA